METYEKKYKEALERAKKLQETCNGTAVVGWCEYIFPELVESEDEKIRKEILKHIQLCTESIPDRDKYIAWLEKQKTSEELNWKPSKEQDKALDYAFNNLPDTELGKYYEGVLLTLIEDLHRFEKQGEKKPIIEMKSPEESLGISSEEYNDIINECLYGESKPSDKVEPKEYTFKSLPRLLDMIEPSDRATAYCQKLIGALVREGYTTDAKIVGECLKQMNGEKVAMAVMDEKQCGTDNCPLECSTNTVTTDSKKNKVEPKFHEGDFIKHNEGNYICKVISVNSDSYYLEHIETSDRVVFYNAEQWFHLWTIKDAKDGDVLVCDSKHGQEIGIVKKYIGKYGGCDTCFETYCFVDWDGIFRVDEYIGSRNIRPATKYQHDILFQKMKEAGYEWNAEKKKLKKIKQKPTDKIEPNLFHEGDWITNGEYTWKIIEVKPLDYILQSQDGGVVGDTISYVNKKFYLWTIQDAKDGDVLVDEDNNIGIYKETDGTDWDSYIYLGCDGKFLSIIGGRHRQTDTHPATKEQRDLLFQKMKEAGCEWNAEKKELKKIHIIDEGKAEMDYCFTKMMNGEKVSSAWSEEDEINLQGIIDEIQANKSSAPSYDINVYDRYLGWLKFLKDRYTWKPSDEQINTLRDAIVYVEGCNSNFKGNGSVLENLYNDLKKLK